MKSYKEWKELHLENDQDSKKIVQDAIDNTDPVYLEKSLTQRNPSEQSAGSTFKSAQTAESLKQADWKPLQHSPEAIKSPAIAYEAPIPGRLGVADVNDFSDSLQAVIEPSHAGKGVDLETGNLKAQLVATLPGGYPEVDFTTMILGPTREDPNKLQVWTFHPGAPVRSENPVFMDDMKKKFNTTSNAIPTTIGEAKKLGFQFVKHVTVLPNSLGGKVENRLYALYLSGVISEEVYLENLQQAQQAPQQTQQPVQQQTQQQPKNADINQIASQMQFQPTSKKKLIYQPAQDLNNMPALSYIVAQQKMPVVTFTSDGKETQNVAEPNDIIISGPSQEKYVIKAAKFPKLYVGQLGGPIHPEQGPRNVAVYSGNVPVSFTASWGENMVLKPGDYLVKEDEGKYYRIAKKEYEMTYNPPGKVG